MENQSAEITPFRGLRYDTEVAGNLADLLAPPYDVISPEMQDELYRKSEFNIVRLIRGKVQSDDTEQNNRYTRAAKTITEWIEKGVLKRDKSPAIYVYAQTYTALGEEKTRVGFIARKKLEEFGGSVLPHEKTLTGPKTDRLNLTRACKCNFSQIFGLYTDKERKTDELLNSIVMEAPDMDATTDDNLRHRLWAVTDPQWIEQLVNSMQNKNIMIADGHHRYETALNYLKENSTGGRVPTEDMKYVMMYFTNTESEGLTILPTHRIVKNLKDFDLDRFIADAGKKFSIQEITSPNGNRNDTAENRMTALMSETSAPVIGLYSGKGRYAVLTYKSNTQNGPLEKLDVGILHSKLLEPLLGIGPKELAAQSHVTYSTDVATASGKVDSGNSQLAFFLKSTPIEQMRDVAEAGLKMPQKSTYFYPKLISGMVINPVY